MPKKPSSDPSFPDIIEGAAPRVEDYDSAFEKEAEAVPGARKVPESDPANPYGIDFTAYDFNYHHQVFVIWRPWRECGRCQTAIKNKTIELPDVGDYVCPHTHHDEYVRTMQSFLDKGFLQQTRQESMLVDGSIQVSMAWIVPKANAKKVRDILRERGSNTSEGV